MGSPEAENGTNKVNRKPDAEMGTSGVNKSKT